MTPSDLILAGLFFLAAALYGSVGHAGASAYLASMALLGTPETTMKPTALILNLCAGSLVAFKFASAGFFTWRLFWPFAVTSIPAAWLCGQIHLPEIYFKPLVGFALACAALRLWFTPTAVSEESATAPPPIPVALLTGAAVGVLAGLTGTGGGIFLSPLLVLCGWATLKKASGVAAPIILVNSAAGLIGWLQAQVVNLPQIQAPIAGANWEHLVSHPHLPNALLLWIVAVVAGGWLGSEFGSRRFNSPALRRLLAVVLLVAALKLVGEPVLSALFPKPEQKRIAAPTAASR